MKLEGVRSLQHTIENKINKPVVKQQPQTADLRADRNTVENKFIEQKNVASSLKEILNKRFDTARAELKAASAPPLDYFEIDKQADELLKKHSKDGKIGNDLNTDELGKDLAAIAKTDPDRAAALTDNILDKVENSDKDEVAQSMVEAMSPAELREFAKTDKGKETLGQLKEHLTTGSVHDDEKATAARIDAAIQAADFQNSAEFKKLSPETQNEVLQRLDANQGDKEALTNLINLTKSAEFAGLSPKSQQQILQSFDKNKGDAVYTQALIDVSGNADFRGLTEAEQSNVLKDLERFATTESYKGKEGGWFGIGKREVSADEKTYMLGLIAGTSIYSQQNPGNTTVKNSLEKIVSGEIKMEAYFDDSASGRNVNGTASDDTIRMNRFANSTRTIEQQIDTFAHEVNHIVNGDTDAGTPERFLDEFRARVVGREAGGRPFDADIQRASLDQLTSGGGAYQHLNDLYNSDADFKAVIDAVYADLNKTPPVLTTPEELRQKLVDAGFDSDYLKTPGNLDNH